MKILVWLVGNKMLVLRFRFPAGHGSPSRICAARFKIHLHHSTSYSHVWQRILPRLV